MDDLDAISSKAERRRKIDQKQLEERLVPLKMLIRDQNYSQYRISISLSYGHLLQFAGLH